MRRTRCDSKGKRRAIFVRVSDAELVAVRRLAIANRSSIQDYVLNLILKKVKANHEGIAAVNGTDSGFERRRIYPRPDTPNRRLSVGVHNRSLRRQTPAD